MKKATFPAFGLLVSSLVFLSGCQAAAVPEVSSQPISEVSARENTTQSENAFYNDLLYREYSLGERVEAGTATITKADILSASDSPSQIVIFRVPEDGTYCYMVADENKKLQDITELVDMETIGDVGDWIIPLT